MEVQDENLEFWIIDRKDEDFSFEDLEVLREQFGELGFKISAKMSFKAMCDYCNGVRKIIKDVSFEPKVESGRIQFTPNQVIMGTGILQPLTNNLPPFPGGCVDTKYCPSCNIKFYDSICLCGTFNCPKCNASLQLHSPTDVKTVDILNWKSIVQYTDTKPSGD